MATKQQRERIAARLDELMEEAVEKGIDLAGLESWDPYGLLINVGGKLGLTVEETVAPLRA